MNIDLHTRVENHKKTPLLEVVNIEKLWWGLMNSKGILNTEVQDLFRKARILYEKIIFNDYEVVELQEVEYCLWKLHYKCIDEFRKRVKSACSSASNLQKGIDIHTEGFRYFLFEATEFYKELIANTKKFYEKYNESISAEALKLHSFRYIHHRFLVCLGDLARYRELSKKNDVENRNWSDAANYYLQATKVCPDSGNPQNQLALLATYVGDDFLALYHCVRSLAVKEPFPDAWDNLMLLFENNRSSHLPSLSVKDRFDFSNPSQRVYSLANSHERKVDLWPLFVRMISFFLVKSSLEDFSFIFASTVRELESLLLLDDIKLRDLLESYERMDSVKKGPYRTLQIVAALTFILHKLDKNLETNDQKEKYCLALTAAFVIMGRIIERCNSPDFCLLLAAVLVFIEWLVSVLDKMESFSDDEKVSCSVSYFFGAFSDFFNRLDTKDSEITSNNALWEDNELRGFVPISQENISFVSQENSENGSRICRLFLAGMKIAEKPQKWISYDKSRKKFYTAKDHDNRNEESQSQIQAQSPVKGDTVSIEEEEVILFRPITRFNSVPIDYDKILGQDSLLINESPTSDESLKRASSLFDPKNRVQPGFSKPVKLPEPATFPPAGPPSLSAWVIKKENLTKDFIKQDLNPIEEIDSSTGSTHIAELTQEPLPYIAPVPSAPFLPEDAVWFEGNLPYIPEKVDGILGPSPTNRSVNLGPLDHSVPYSGMSSSEWLYNYQNRNNHEGRGNNGLPVRENYSSHYAFDRWQNPTVSDLTVYTEGPQMYVGPGRENGSGYQKPPLLQYLKGREWQLRGLHNMGN